MQHRHCTICLPILGFMRRVSLEACLNRRGSRRASTQTLSFGFAALCGLTSLSLSAGAQTALKRLPAHIPPLVAEANLVGRAPAQEMVPLALTLPLRNQAQLNALLQRLYDPHDALYGQYLTSAQFVARFAPTQADYDAVIGFARAQGLTVTAMHPNRLVLDVVGTSQNVEAAFGVKLKQYRLPEGRMFRAPDSNPALPVAIANRLQGVVGLDTADVWRPHNIRKPVDPLAFLNQPLDLSFSFHPNVTGSGPGGGLSPSDIKTAYNLNTVTQTGAGQTLALFELDGYKASDITSYESFFAIPAVPLQNVLVDGFAGTAGAGADEVTLDIELQIALARGVSKILVYEGPNSNAGVVDTYNRIATDNLAKSISTSWGLAENSNSAAVRNSENTAFQQMAAQGQSIFAASGDSGAKDNGSTLSVDDPASQPFMTGVGGTRLTTSGAGGPYGSETTWNGGSVAAGAGGGGISTVWSQPSYQTGVATTANQGSATARNVPDVSLDADPNNGYAIFVGGRWGIFGGTSCAAPLWSAFTVLVNQNLVAQGKAVVGFANPQIYTIGKGTTYTSTFHDIADGSNNLFYPAVTGYDLATGWGSFNGANLLAAFTGGTVTPPPPPPPPPTQLLGNPGFENGSASPAPWTATPAVVDGSAGEPAHSGSWKAWLDGYGTTHTDTLAQTVTIPSTIATATLTFFLHIDTAETTTTLANDKLTVQIRNSSGTVLTTLATYSNLNKNTGYAQQSFNLIAFKGQTVQVFLSGTENASRQTSFVVDDFALNVL
jgi:kumamolisin